MKIEKGYLKGNLTKSERFAAKIHTVAVEYGDLNSYLKSGPSPRVSLETIQTDFLTSIFTYSISASLHL